MPRSKTICTVIIHRSQEGLAATACKGEEPSVLSDRESLETMRREIVEMGDKVVVKIAIPVRDAIEAKLLKTTRDIWNLTGDMDLGDFIAHMILTGYKHGLKARSK